jgi:hypothetical protein
MEFVQVTSEYSIVVRLASLSERGIPWEELLLALRGFCTIRAFGPHFGGEALDALVRRLSALGLQYFDDFFEFSGDFPKWCSFAVSAAHKAVSHAD